MPEMKLDMALGVKLDLASGNKLQKRGMTADMILDSESVLSGPGENIMPRMSIAKLS